MEKRKSFGEDSFVEAKEGNEGVILHDERQSCYSQNISWDKETEKGHFRKRKLLEANRAKGDNN
ncbi:MAG TPA: hypothetical protein VGK59_24085 [Ohtaekwangia sp.]